MGSNKNWNTGGFENLPRTKKGQTNQTNHQQIFILWCNIAMQKRTPRRADPGSLTFGEGATFHNLPNMNILTLCFVLVIYQGL